MQGITRKSLVYVTLYEIIAITLSFTAALLVYGECTGRCGAASAMTSVVAVSWKSACGLVVLKLGAAPAAQRPHDPPSAISGNALGF